MEKESDRLLGQIWCLRGKVSLLQITHCRKWTFESEVHTHPETGYGCLALSVPKPYRPTMAPSLPIAAQKPCAVDRYCGGRKLLSGWFALEWINAPNYYMQLCD